MTKLYSLLILVALFAAACTKETPRPNTNTVTNTNTNTTAANTNASTKPANPNRVVNYTYEVVNTYPHDPKAFTEGLFFQDGFLYESTGLEKKSDLRKVELETGKVVQKAPLPPESFGEGISLMNGKIYQLTYQEGLCRVFDAATFKFVKDFTYTGEGWGMTHDDKNLIMSNGSHIISYINPDTFQTERTIAVFDEKGKPLMDINELELIKGELWANVWHSENIGKPNHIARIDPATGKLLGWINLENISPDDSAADPENTLNGIAYDAATDRIFVTGKNWKKLFEIKVKEVQ